MGEASIEREFLVSVSGFILLLFVVCCMLCCYSVNHMPWRRLSGHCPALERSAGAEPTHFNIIFSWHSDVKPVFGELSSERGCICSEFKSMKFSVNMITGWL